MHATQSISTPEKCFLAYLERGITADKVLPTTRAIASASGRTPKEKRQICNKLRSFWINWINA